MVKITVTPADDDEVIVAGAPAGPSANGEQTAKAPTIEARPVQAPSADVRPAQDPVRQRDKGVQSKAHRETTLEDLESSQMPIAQKVVIVAAVVCIIGALIYYFVAMR